MVDDKGILAKEIQPWYLQEMMLHFDKLPSLNRFL